MLDFFTLPFFIGIFIGGLIIFAIYPHLFKKKEDLSSFQENLGEIQKTLKDMNESKLGGNAETISSPTFGTKTFYKYDWCGTGGYAEVFQYVYNKK